MMTSPSDHPTPASAAELHLPLSRGRAVLRFTVHYLEMVVAMVVGMVALGPLESFLARAVGRPDALDGSTVSMLLMAVNMTVPMAAWMRVRGHRWRLTAEMCAGMDVPFLLVLVPYWAGAISEMALMMVGHTVMFVGMAAAMVVRRQEYAGHGH
ncbi:hypothetical protein [Actinopolymorpha cephalotaxi]|uniref:Flagellar biosynthetic protein FliP n=2 Tax=Actinopolymorpha cephalotaxi TaxID=504797 RepID=A0ABX2S2L6_9ACTN|nr:hypothetical protein [Actinopolymorpha cephalotaxi]NYH83838.1 hypothetical protein [Actinopolymorpha cephalotaxi]